MKQSKLLMVFGTYGTDAASGAGHRYIDFVGFSFPKRIGVVVDHVDPEEYILVTDEASSFASCSSLPTVPPEGVHKWSKDVSRTVRECRLRSPSRWNTFPHCSSNPTLNLSYSNLGLGLWIIYVIIVCVYI